ncbi:MAG TPA: DUF4136 domain-containing protein [Vicinamibacterales bacterium]|nr:DUF4136 domain-containing protein [Vicinamibacterales bacterium]
MRRRILISVGFCVAWSTALLAQKVTSEFDDTVDFSKFKTFAVRDGKMDSPSPALNGELTKKRIQTAIERALTAKGLTKTTEASDLNVFFTLGSWGVVDREEFPAGPRGLRTRVERVPAVRGNLVIGLRDPSTRSLVWRGIASDDKANPIDISKKIDDWVKKIIDKYPPKK